MITIDYQDREVLDALTRLSARMRDLTPAMRDIAGVLADAAERAFQHERDPASGVPWAALSPVTQALRAKRGHWPGPKLQVSGQLAASVTTAYGRTQAQVGTNKAYAAMQQFGGTTSPRSMIPGKTIPARPFLGLGTEDQAEILEIVQHYLAG